MQEAMDRILIAVQELVHKKKSLDWEWLYDFHTAGDILGMSAQSLTYFMRKHHMYIQRNKFNGLKFVTAKQIKQIREMVLERVRIDKLYPPLPSKKPTGSAAPVPTGSSEEAGPTLQGSWDQPAG